mmetsp:Transcript_29174/g.57122  ORF Transcript_29174/g.57122 Transcript_29174/m.57122 type:complete len:187 (+) Transcript_29174:76-636(+)
MAATVSTAYEAPPAAEAEAAQAVPCVQGLLRWLRDDEFITRIAEWSWDACSDFPCGQSAADSEASGIGHPLHLTEVHREYRGIFEARAQEYLVQHGISTEDFLRLTVQALVEDEDADDLLDGLVASEDYLAFFSYMQGVRRRREWAERAMCGCSDELDWGELVKRSLRTRLGDMDVGDDDAMEHLE